MLSLVSILFSMVMLAGATAQAAGCCLSMIEEWEHDLSPVSTSGSAPMLAGNGRHTMKVKVHDSVSDGNGRAFGYTTWLASIAARHIPFDHIRSRNSHLPKCIANIEVERKTKN